MTAPKQPRHLPIAGAKIYALCEPRSRKPTVKNIRYIGLTRYPLPRRLREHWNRPAREVRGWLQVLGSPPEIFLLEDLDGENAYVLHAREHDHIDHWRKAGANLLNTSNRAAWVRNGPPPT